jgi:hypothetical protein
MCRKFECLNCIGLELPALRRSHLPSESPTQKPRCRPPDDSAIAKVILFGQISRWATTARLLPIIIRWPLGLGRIVISAQPCKEPRG